MGFLHSPLGSSILATGIPQILADFNSTNAELGSLVVSVYLLGFAAGPLIIAPLSELYGRTPLYHICNTLFAILTVGCALGPSLNSEIALRFLQGCAGSAPLAIGGGTISDLIPQERRGKYMGIYALGPTLGPIFGPVAGGFLTRAKGWRWLMWLLLMIVSKSLHPPVLSKPFFVPVQLTATDGLGRNNHARQLRLHERDLWSRDRGAQDTCIAARNRKHVPALQV